MKDEEFMLEYHKIIRKYFNLENEEIRRLKESGRDMSGLDGHHPELVALSKERDRKIEELKKEYLASTQRG